MKSRCPKFQLPCEIGKRQHRLSLSNYYYSKVPSVKSLHGKFLSCSAFRSRIEVANWFSKLLFTLDITNSKRYERTRSTSQRHESSNIHEIAKIKTFRCFSRIFLWLSNRIAFSGEPFVIIEWKGNLVRICRPGRHKGISWNYFFFFCFSYTVIYQLMVQVLVTISYYFLALSLQSI